MCLFFKVAPFYSQDVVPVDEPLAASPETIETAVARTSDTSSPEEIFVGLEWAAESTAGEEFSAGEKLGADVEVLLSTDEVCATELVETENKLLDKAAIPVPGGPALGHTFTNPVVDPLGERTQILQILKPSVVGQEGEEEETLTTDLPPEKPGEESILSENTASGDSGEPALTETFTELAFDHLLDPPREQAQIIKPAVVHEEEEKPEESREPAATLGAELRFSSLDRAPSVGNTDIDQPVAEEDVDTDVDVEVRN